MNRAERDFKKQLRKRRWIGWSCTLFFGFCLAVAVAIGDVLFSLLSLLMTGLGIWVLAGARKMSAYTSDYRPGEGFKRFRKTRGQKLRALTLTQWAILVFAAAVLVFDAGSHTTMLTVSLVSLLSIQFYIKPRIKLHRSVDALVLDELRYVGLFAPEEEVRALYKDFELWTDARPGSMVLAATRYDYVAAALRPDGHFDAVRIPLTEVRQLRIQNTGMSGRALLLSVGDGRYEQIERHLRGRSRTDSPEEFISDFLAILDECRPGYERPQNDSWPA
ncbi:hypothetical protein QWJ34_13890 [Saccharibacillus sp. CPCC 101409]|uniref:hypothetical protein n=1 Tax=Saccharibacillus sp. CPCC 101409 TaxID=3058041 RepID=UPI0026722DC4|nr:hypothetical protein [Saccharibacillus sp. CPCC 101409]MDO3410859.1 hypothetical protein [Saccharibacillus sp. CPCC 101409]